MIAYGTGGKAKRKTEAEANENSFVVYISLPQHAVVVVAGVGVVVVVVRSAYERGNLLTHIHNLSQWQSILLPLSLSLSLFLIYPQFASFHGAYE